MSAIDSRMSTVPWPEPIFKLSVDQYHAMIDAGTLTDEDPVELLEGVLVYKMPKNPPHAVANDLAVDILRSIMPPGWGVVSQQPITLPDGEPEPDVLVFRGVRRDYVARHPAPRDVALVAEISDATLHRDRTLKLRSYARAGVRVYWIINLIDRVVEVHAAPTTETPEPTYRQRQVFDVSASVPLELDGRVVAQIPVVDLLP